MSRAHYQHPIINRARELLSRLPVSAESLMIEELIQVILDMQENIEFERKMVEDQFREEQDRNSYRKDDYRPF